MPNFHVIFALSPSCSLSPPFSLFLCVCVNYIILFCCCCCCFILASVLLVVKVNNLFAYSRSQFQFLEESSPRKRRQKSQDLVFFFFDFLVRCVGGLNQEPKKKIRNKKWHHSRGLGKLLDGYSVSKLAFLTAKRRSQRANYVNYEVWGNFRGSCRRANGFARF